VSRWVSHSPSKTGVNALMAQPILRAAHLAGSLAGPGRLQGTARACRCPGPSILPPRRPIGLQPRRASSPVSSADSSAFSGAPDTRPSEPRNAPLGSKVVKERTSRHDHLICRPNSRNVRTSDWCVSCRSGSFAGICTHLQGGQADMDHATRRAVDLHEHLSASQLTTEYTLMGYPSSYRDSDRGRLPTVPTTGGPGASREQAGRPRALRPGRGAAPSRCRRDWRAAMRRGPRRSEPASEPLCLSPGERRGPRSDGRRERHGAQRQNTRSSPAVTVGAPATNITSP
jgi:hypothetical protein